MSRAGSRALVSMGGLWRTVMAVGAAFVGLRRGVDLERDSASLKPMQLIVVAFLALGVFVGSLIGLVHWVVAR